MLLGSIQMCGERISSVEVGDVCESLEGHSIRLLSLRECLTADWDFKKLMRSVSKCKSIIQMNLNLGLVSKISRVGMLAHALEKNRSLTTLLLHGSPLGDEGITRLVKALVSHPNIVTVDFGDCQIGDEGLQQICELLPPDGAKPGMQDLTLSANPAITAKGWALFSVAMAASNGLKSLYLDYNGIGDYGAGCLAVAIASSRTLEILDLEGTGMTEHGAQVFLHLIQNYPVMLKQLVLDENRISPKTTKAINACLEDENASEISDQQSVTSTTTSYSEVTSVESDATVIIKKSSNNSRRSSASSQVTERGSVKSSASKVSESRKSNTLEEEEQISVKSDKSCLSSSRSVSTGQSQTDHTNNQQNDTGAHVNQSINSQQVLAHGIDSEGDITINNEDDDEDIVTSPTHVTNDKDQIDQLKEYQKRLEAVDGDSI